MSGQPSLRGEREAGAVLLRGGPIAALAALAVCVSAAVLVPLHLWQPVIALPVISVGWAAAWRCGCRLPARPVPVWTAISSVAVSLGFGGWAALTHAEHLVLRRDAGSYALFAQWIATRHELPVTAQLSAFGGPAALNVPGFTLASPAFFQVLHGSGSATTAEVVPQFLLGAPALFSLGWWADGWAGLLLVPALSGVAALLAVAALTARLVGPGWAPLATAAVGLSQPVLHAARSTYSETPSLLVLLGAACLAVDALSAPVATSAKRPAAAAGLMLGLVGLIRVDAPREVALLVLCCAVLALGRHPAAVPMASGALLGTAAAAVPAVLLSLPYLMEVRGSLLPLLAGLFGAAALCAAAVLWARHRPVPPLVGRRWAAAAAGGGVLLLWVVLASRPLWLVNRQNQDGAAAMIAALQGQQGLPIDPNRTYAEQSLVWVVWYLGIPLVIAAVIGFVALAALSVLSLRRDAGVSAAVWVPAAVGLGSVALTLYRPGITPDHPWADRRLVPVVLPAMVLVAAGTAAWCLRLARRRFPASLYGAGIVVMVVVFVLPAALTTAPVALLRTERGSSQAITAVCAALQPADVVLAIDGLEPAQGRAQNEWVQVIRGVCGHPAAALNSSAAQLPGGVARLGRLVSARGGRLVLLAADDDPASSSGVLAELGSKPREVASITTLEDPRLLVRPATRPNRLDVDVWLSVWSPPAGG